MIVDVAVVRTAQSPGPAEVVMPVSAHDGKGREPTSMKL